MPTSSGPFLPLAHRKPGPLPTLPTSESELRAAAFLLAAFSIFLQPMQVSAQTDATIAGSWSDPSGAAIPGGTLTLKNQDTAVVLNDHEVGFKRRSYFPAVPAPAHTPLRFRSADSRGWNKRTLRSRLAREERSGQLTLAVGSTPTQ